MAPHWFPPEGFKLGAVDFERHGRPVLKKRATLIASVGAPKTIGETVHFWRMKIRSVVNYFLVHFCTDPYTWMINAF